MVMLENQLTEFPEPFLMAVEDSIEATAAGNTECLCIGVAGPRGSCKTLLLALFGLLYLDQGLPVLSTVPIGGKFGNGTDALDIHAQDLESTDLWTFADKLNGALVVIDEIQEFGADNRTSMAVKNKLLNRLSIQVRKRSIAMAYSVQDFDWVDKRFAFQTDVLIQSRDLFHSPWGREHRIKRGTWASYEFRDLSGYVTGTPWKEFPRPFGSMVLHAKQMWPYFKSFEIVGEYEAFRKPKLRTEEVMIGIDDGKRDIHDLNNIEAIVAELYNNGATEITNREIVRRLGHGAQPAKVGLCMSQLGYEGRMTKHGKVYTDTPKGHCNE